MFGIKFFLLLSAVFAICFAYPMDNGALDDDDQHFGQDAYALDAQLVEEPTYVPTHFRAKRATCDLLSAFNVGHAACAANCLRLGYRGGYCNGQAVCNCRR